MENFELVMVTNLLIIIIAYIIIQMRRIYKYSEIPNLIVITNAFLTTAIIFFTSKIYELTKNVFEDGFLETIKILNKEGFPPDDVGVFLFFAYLSLLIVLIACCIIVNMISDFIKIAAKESEKEQNEEITERKLLNDLANIIKKHPRRSLGFVTIICIFSILKILSVIITD
ncbi:hypothetical protein MmiEs2_14060 [Methanimicrococcus stummii]|uniref:Uncharacterized protein n=1 Tax=Methanimicrococcus stummii TaxID=3028294 RepID=A0AA97A8K6_9EURY|nr:hypothetical protein [Methanimicrococcus sp. Es2]WNY29183.1 hypothetical protein MmiEs2_14060 [Methanimicrococcus sp. Es2]